MSANPFFGAAFALVVGLEGNYSNNPADPGGETKYGISKRAYPALDIPNLTLDDAKGIYVQDYWLAAGCDVLSWEMALCVFDCAVNQGVGVAKSLYVQHGTTSVDFMGERALRYASLQTFATFGRGWMRRLMTIMKAAQFVPGGST